MKTLTVKQPWAYLICSGIKDIENRTWPTKFRGRVLIHASASKMKFYPDLFTSDQILSIGKVKYDPDKYQYGAIIGSVEIVDCVINHPSIWAEKTPDYTIGINPKIYKEMTDNKPIYNWVLANPVLFAQPIPAKGKLSFWEYPMTEKEYFNLEKIWL